MPDTDPVVNAAKPFLGYALNGLSEQDQKQVATNYLSTLTQSAPIPGEPSTHSLLSPIMGEEERSPDSYYDAFNGYQINQGIVSRLVWNTDKFMSGMGWYRSVTGGVDQPMQQFIPGQGLIDYKPDQWFKDNQKQLEQTPTGRALLDRWITGDFDDVSDSTHLAALVGFYQTEDQLGEEAAKLGTGESIAFGLGLGLLEVPVIMGAFNAAKLGPVLWGGQRATAVGMVARNVQQGLAISAVNEGGLMIASDRDLEEAAGNLAAGAAFDAVAAGVWESVFKVLGRSRAISPEDLAERAGTAEAIKEVVKADKPPTKLEELLKEKAAAWKARQESVEFTQIIDTENFDFYPAYKELESGKIIRVTANIDFDRITTEGGTRTQGFLISRKKDGQVVRFLPLEDFNRIKDANIASRDATMAGIEAEQHAMNKAIKPPITTGLLDPINPKLTMDDFAQIETSSGKIADKVLGGQTGWFSKYGLESSKNPVINLLVTRLFDRVRTVKGWANGRVAGFASFESRRKMQHGKQSRIRRALEKQVRDIIYETAGPVERRAIRFNISNEVLSQSLLAKRQTVMELLELRRIARLLKMDDVLEPSGSGFKAVTNAPQLEPDIQSSQAILARRDALLKRAGDLGLPTDISKYKVNVEGLFDLEFLAPSDAERLGKQIDTTRRSIMAQYARVRLNPEEITFDGVLNTMRAIQNKPLAPPQVVFEQFMPNGRFHRLEWADILPANQNSEQTLKRLAQAWNEDQGGYVNSKHVGEILEHMPQSRLNSMVSVDSFMEFVDQVEAHTVFRQIVRELGVADSRFRGREDVQTLLAQLNDPAYDPFDPKDWEYGPVPYGAIRSEIKEMMLLVEDHAKKVATEIPHDTGGEQKVERLMGYMRRQLGYERTDIWTKERQLSDIAGNVTRATLLTKSGISQVADTAAPMTIASMNGVQGSIKKTMGGMLTKWHEMAGTPALRNALFRGLALTGESNLSFASQRFSASDYELAVSRISDNQDRLGRTRGVSESLSEAVSVLSGTSLMNSANKAGALVGVLHELTDPEVGIILKLKTALDKFAAAKAQDIIPFLKAEGVQPELGELTLRTLNRSDIETLAAKIKAGEFDEVKLKKRFGFLGMDNETSVRLVGEPLGPDEAVAIEKLAHTVNYLIDRRIAVPGMMESGLGVRGFANEMMATFIRQPMAVATRMLIGSSYRSSLARFTLLMSLLSGSVIVGFAKALLAGQEDEWAQNLQEHPARFVMDRLAWSGAFGWLGEKLTAVGLDATSPDAFKRTNVGEQQVIFPGQSVVRVWGQAAGGAMNVLWNGEELNQSHVNAMWKTIILGETTVFKGIARVWNGLRDEDEYHDGRDYLRDALDATVGVKEGKKR